MLNPFFHNRNQAGKLWVLLFALAELADALTILLTLGYVSTRFPLEVSKKQVGTAIKKQKAAREK